MQQPARITLLTFAMGVLLGLRVARTAARFRADPQPTRGRAVFWWSFAANIGVIALYGGALAFSFAVLNQAKAAAGDKFPSWLVAFVVMIVPFVAAAIVSNTTASVANLLFGAPLANPVPPHKNFGAHTRWFPTFESGWFLKGHTYKVFVTDDMLSGARVGGTIVDPETNSEEEHNKIYWVRTLAATLYERIDVTCPEFLALHRRNFHIRWRDIADVEYDPDKRWGQPGVAHSGQLILHLHTGRQREFLLLGDQNGEELAEEFRQTARQKQPASGTFRSA